MESLSHVLFVGPLYTSPRIAFEKARPHVLFVCPLYTSPRIAFEKAVRDAGGVWPPSLTNFVKSSSAWNSFVSFLCDTRRFKLLQEMKMY